MRCLQPYICIFAFFIYILTSIYCIHNSLPYMQLFSYHLCISSMCCLIIYFLISCIYIIYSFHIFLYSYYSSIHIISYIHIYSYSLSNLYPSIQFGTARNPVPKISNIQSQNLRTKSHSLFLLRKQPMSLHGFYSK